MDLFAFQTEILKAIQSVANPFLDFLAKVVTYLGSQYVIVLVIAFLVWCVDKKKGYFVAWCCCWGLAFSNGIKGIFKVPRPIGTDGIRTLAEETATSYSFPSGHSANSATLMSSLVLVFKNKILFCLSFILPILVGLSRLYLGCHWPLDVLAGLLLGFVLPRILYRIYHKFSDKKFFFLVLSFLLLTPLCFLKGDVADFWKSLGIFFGVVVGEYIEEKYIGLSTDIPGKKKIIRFLVGAVVVATVYLLMKFVFPVSLWASFFRYSLVSITGLVICPLVFQKFNI